MDYRSYVRYRCIVGLIASIVIVILSIAALVFGFVFSDSKFIIYGIVGIGIGIIISSIFLTILRQSKKK